MPRFCRTPVAFLRNPEKALSGVGGVELAIASGNRGKLSVRRFQPH